MTTPSTPPALQALTERLRAEGILEYNRAEKPFMFSAQTDPKDLVATTLAIQSWLDTNGLGHFLVVATFMPCHQLSVVSVSESSEDFTVRAVAVASRRGGSC